MEHRTDEGHEGFGAAADEETRDEATGTAVGEVATAVADEDDGEEPEAATEEVSVEAAAAGGTTNGTAPATGADRVELYTDAEREGFRERWDALLAGFVDDPRAAAEEADELIGELVDAISRRRQQLHDALEDDDDDGETETMRQAILRYRAIYRALVRE